MTTTITGSPQRHRRFAAAAGPLAVVLVAASLVGCDSGSNRDAHGPSSATSGGAPSPVPFPPPSPPGPATYRAVDDLCAVADLSALESRHGTRNPAGATAGTHQTGGTTFMDCFLALGAAGNGALVGISAQVHDPPGAEATFRGLRDAEQNPVTPVPGLGADAYSYVDPVTGPHLVTYHGNLHLILWVKPGRAAGGSADLIAPIVQVCRAVMTALRTPQ